MSESLTVGGIYRVIKTAFRDTALESIDLEARWIIEHVTGLYRADQIISERQNLSSGQEQAALQIMNRRLDGEPLDNIFGYKEFYGLRFDINGQVLSPRPETEMLVEFVLERTGVNDSFNLLDLGTGTGAIPIAILSRRPSAQAVATDISDAALQIAKKNAGNHRVEQRLKVIKSNWTHSVNGQYDFVLSNPPYVDAVAMEGLDAEVKYYDPKLALFGGQDGLDAYRKILDGIHNTISEDGWLAVEIGFDQGTSVSDLFAQAGFSKIEILKDLAGLDRVVFGKCDESAQTKIDTQKTEKRLGAGAGLC